MSAQDDSEKICQMIHELENMSLKYNGVELKPFSDDWETILSIKPSEDINEITNAMYGLQGNIDKHVIGKVK